MLRLLKRALDGIAPAHTLNGPLGLRIPMAALIQTLAVSEYLNFRHAANALRRQPIKRQHPREDVGGRPWHPPFERHARGVRLTEAGRYFFPTRRCRHRASRSPAAIVWRPDGVKVSGAEKATLGEISTALGA
jgi:hypothetical protein